MISNMTDNSVVQRFSLEDFTQVNEDIEAAVVRECDGNIVNDVKKIRGDMTMIMKDIARLRAEVLHHRKEFDEFKSFMMESVRKILEISCKISSSPHESQSLLVGCKQHVIEEPFMTIRFPTGEQESVFLPKHIVQDLLACTTERELIRRILLIIHNNSITELRQYTLTGNIKSSRKAGMDSMDSETQVDVSPSKKQLPFRSYLIAQAAVEKIFAVPEQLKFDNPVVYQTLMTKKVKEVRSHITSVLNYFSSSFDEFGIKIRKGREENEASETTVLNSSRKRRKLDMNQNSHQSPDPPLPNELAGTGCSQQELHTAPCGLEFPQNACQTMDHQFCSLPTLVKVTSSQGVSVVKFQLKVCFLVTIYL